MVRMSLRRDQKHPRPLHPDRVQQMRGWMSVDTLHLERSSMPTAFTHQPALDRHPVI